ncbi:MAG: App1 family protein [Actinomycetes bacterium]
MADTGVPPVAWVARVESAVERSIALFLWRRGWRPRLVPFTGYGAAAGPGQGWVRVLARVLLMPPRERTASGDRRRGFRRFLTVSLAGVHVELCVGDGRRVVRSNRSGYIDAVVPVELPAGWHPVTFAAGEAATASGQVRVVGADEEVGIVSDIDDTVMVTAIPRPMLALWNSFVRHESARSPVPGMAKLLAQLRAADADAFVVYVSTGAFNVAPSLARFLDRHGYPRGPLLLTDWGPTEGGWFRSGREHKHETLRRLLRELPWLRWVLVGDDGQHDPALYDELVAELPGRVDLIAIRQLSETEQLLTHGAPAPRADAREHSDGQPGDGVRRLRGRDGHELLRELSGGQ